MSGTRESKNKYLKYTAIILLFIMIISAALLFLHFWENQQGLFPVQGDDVFSDSVEYNGQEYELKDNIETLLIMGLDKFGSDINNGAYNNDQQADFLMLFVIDNENSTCKAIQINRDAMTEINVLGVAGEKIGTVNGQIALSHTYGNGKEVSCRNTMDAVSNLLLGRKINNYVSVTMDTVPIYNDLVGGVELTVLDDFTGIDDTLIKGETVTLTGEHALNYVRDRYGMDDSSNATRMIRQRQYIEALYNKTLKCIEDDEEFIVETSVKMSDYMLSDCSIEKLQNLLKKISAYDFGGIYTLEGESVVGEEFIEFYPDEESLKKTVVELFYKPKD